MANPHYTTVTLVANAARNIAIASGKTATMQESDANQFIDEAESIMDSKLSALMYTPLHQITRSNVTAYPNPIQFIATRIAAALMVRSVFSRIEPQVSENANAHLKDAMDELNEICDGIYVGSRRIEGQVLKARSNFMDPYSAPLEPPNPSGYPRS